MKGILHVDRSRLNINFDEAYFCHFSSHRGSYSIFLTCVLIARARQILGLEVFDEYTVYL